MSLSLTPLVNKAPLLNRTGTCHISRVGLTERRQLLFYMLFDGNAAPNAVAIGVTVDRVSCIRSRTLRSEPATTTHGSRLGEVQRGQGERRQTSRRAQTDSQCAGTFP